MKKIFLLTLLLLLLVCLMACNSASADLSNVSAAKMADSVKESITFVDDMFNIKNEMVPDFYNLPDGVTELKVFMSSSGATAEELAIFKCDSAQTAEAVVKSCEKRIEALKEKFEDYIPEELVKIENAVIEKRDVFVMFVCADSTDSAEEIFAEYK